MKKSFLNLLFVLISISYAQAFEHTALVLIDMQDQFFERNDNSDSEEVKTLIENNKEVLLWGVKNELPVLIFEYDGFGPTTETLAHVYQDHQHKTVIKYRDGGFAILSDAKEEALKFLKSKGIENLIVMGINGPYCVKSTVLGALENEFEVYTAGDIVADVNPNPPTFPDTNWWMTDQSLLHTYENYVEIIDFFEEKYSVQNNEHLARVE